MTDVDVAAAAMRFLADGLREDPDPQDVSHFVLTNPKAAALALDAAIAGLRSEILDPKSPGGVDSLGHYCQALYWSSITQLSGLE